MKTRSLPSLRRGFTLVEVLVVLALIAMLLFFTVPGLRDVLRGNKLTATADQLIGDLTLARQTAVKESVPIEFRFYRYFDPQAREERFAAYQCFRLVQDLNNPSKYTEKRIAKPVFEKVKPIAAGVVVLDSEQWSPLLKGPGQDLDKRERVKGLVPGEMDTEARYISFIITAEGETNLDRSGAKQWFFTLVNESEYQAAPDPAALRPKNFITLQLDPFTANVRRYQPN